MSSSDSDDHTISRDFGKLHIGDQIKQTNNRIKPSSFNPFEQWAEVHLIDSNPASDNSHLPSALQQTELQTLVASILTPSLKKQDRWNYLSPDHSLFQKARSVWKKHGWSEQQFLNFEKLLCGSRNLPVILLQNPKNDNLPYDEMVSRTETLRWLKKTLRNQGLDLGDIIIMDLFPMITDNYLDCLDGDARRKEVIEDAFDLTIDILRNVKPTIIVSCQCFAAQPGRWVSFTHPVLASLRSSTGGAKKQYVEKVVLDDQCFQVVQAFHPAKLGYEHVEQEEYKKILQGIFKEVYEPCGNWKHYQRKKEIKLKTAVDDITAAASDLLKEIAKYSYMRFSVHGEGTVLDELPDKNLSQWNDLKCKMETIVDRAKILMNGESE